MSGAYVERAPVPSLADVVLCTWSRTTVRPAAEYRIVPDGCADLIWSGRSLFVAGPDTRAHVTPTVRGTLVGVRFAPGAAPAVLGVPAAELTDGRPEFAEIAPGPAVELAERLAGADRPDLVLQQAVATALRREHLDPMLPGLLAGLRRGSTVRELARDLGIGERSLHRCCRAALGYGPKVAQRILRFRYALTLAWAGRGFADTAIHAGYADQAHLAREVRALAGVPLSELVGRAAE